MAYRADIEIAVKGAQELKRLGDQVNATGKLVDGLNTYLENIGAGGVVRNINNLSESVGKAAAVLNEAALGTKEATIAAKNYVIATKDLNDGLREKLALLKQVNEAERQQRLSAAGIRETTQYGGPIGPGPASPVGSLVGQKSPVEERIRRTIDARQDELALQQALLALEEKSAAAANKELQARGEIARLTAQGVNAASFRAAQSGTQLALPAFQERGLQLLDDSVKLNESSLRLERALNGERQRGVRFLEKQTAEERRQVELGILGTRTGALSGTARAAGAVPAGGFPVSGALESPGFRKTRQSVGKFGENLALGAGFPLLFGGGAGSVAGSVLGSFVGPGFGGQILGGALGQILDQAVQKAGQLGTALQKLDLTALEESGIRVNANLENQVRLLLQTGQLTAAQVALQQQVTATTGALPGTVEGVSDAVNVLSVAWSEFTAATSVALGILAAPFAAALGAVLALVNTLVKGFNVAVSALGAAIKVTGEWIVSLVAGDNTLKSINDSLKANNAEIEKARSAYLPILSSLNGEVLLNRDLLNLEAQKTAARTAADKQRNVSLDYQQSLLRINAEYDQKIREENEKTSAANKVQVEEAVRLLNVRRAQSIEEAKIAASIARTRVVEEERTRLAREAERAAKEAERANKEAARAAQDRANALSQIEKEYYNDQLKIIALNVQQVELQDGNIAAMQRQLDLMPSVARIRSEILTIERDTALVEAQRTGTVAEATRLYEQRLRLLQSELNTEAAITEQKKAQAEIEKFYQQIGLNTSPFGAGFGAFRLDINLDPNDTTQQKLDELKTQLKDLTDPINTAISGAAAIGDAFSNSFKGIVSGSMTAREALAGFFQSVADQFLDMAAQIIAKWLQMTILNSILKLFPGGSSFTGGTNYSSYLGSSAFNPAAFSMGPLMANGGVFAQNGIMPFAKGGIVNGPTLFPFANGTGLMGEAGPEAIMPLQRGANGKLGVLASGGGGNVSVVVNVDASGSNVEGDAEDSKQLGRVIAAAIQQELVKQKRPGGLLA